MRAARAGAAVGGRQPGGRWGWVCVGASLLFLALAILVRLTGVLEMERAIYGALVPAVFRALPWQSVTRLGSETILLPASVLLIALLPRQFLRRWWLWIAVMLIVSGLEGLGKVAIGRARPEGLRPGFPSGHTSAAAAFYLMAVYFMAAVVRRRWARVSLYALAGVLVGLVALSRMALRVHWPLDVLGGAALGVGMVAAAVWWHERHPHGWALVAPAPAAWREAVYRWQTVLPLGLLAVLVVKPPLIEESARLDLAFDVLGGLGVAAGLLLRLWTASHAGERATLTRSFPARLVASGPFAYMRQPLPLSTLLIGVGVVLLAESGPGLILIPAGLILLYRVTIPLEERHLAGRFGAAYTDYCARVPRFPRATAPVVIAAAIAVFRPEARHWRAFRQELPAVAATLALAVLAELQESWPHLWP